MTVRDEGATIQVALKHAAQRPKSLLTRKMHEDHSARPYVHWAGGGHEAGECKGAPRPFIIGTKIDFEGGHTESEYVLDILLKM